MKYRKSWKLLNWDQLQSDFPSLWMGISRLFLDVFPQLSPTQVGETLSFSKKKFLSFPKIPWVFLKIPWVYSKERTSFPKFSEFSQFQALKLKFGQIFVQNISTSGLFWAKSQFLVGKLLSFWMICLSFSKICLSFFRLEFFRKR